MGWKVVRGFECPSCKGHVVRAKQIEDFLDQQGAGKFSAFMTQVRGAPVSRRPLVCPACGTHDFRALHHNGVSIDACSRCLCLYFDAGEAALYLRHGLVRKLGADTADATVDGIRAVIDLITDFLD